MSPLPCVTAERVFHQTPCLVLVMNPIVTSRMACGLGLYLASATAERLGGHMACSNIDGEAEVRLLLPADMLFASLK